MARIVKLVAGVDEEEERGHSAAGGAKAKSWAEQLERTYASVGEWAGAEQAGLEWGAMCVVLCWWWWLPPSAARTACTPGARACAYVCVCVNGVLPAKCGCLLSF